VLHLAVADHRSKTQAVVHAVVKTAVVLLLVVLLLVVVVAQPCKPFASEFGFLTKFRNRFLTP